MQHQGDELEKEIEEEAGTTRAATVRPAVGACLCMRVRAHVALTLPVRLRREKLLRVAVPLVGIPADYCFGPARAAGRSVPVRDRRCKVAGAMA